MDSKHSVPLEPQVAVPDADPGEARTARVDRWLVGTVIVLMSAVVALGILQILQRDEAAAPASTRVGLADGATVKMIDDMNEASAVPNGKRFASFFAPNGILEEPNLDEVAEGRKAIAQRMQLLQIDAGFSLEGRGPVVQSGLYLARATTVTTVHENWSAIAVYELTLGGKIRHLWLIGSG